MLKMNYIMGADESHVRAVVQEQVKKTCVRDGILWCVLKDGEIAAVTFRRGALGWGYSLTRESEHPQFNSCPQHYLRECDERCSDWRSEVLIFHRYRGMWNMVQVNDKVRLREGFRPRDLQIVEKNGDIVTGLADEEYHRIPRDSIETIYRDDHIMSAVDL